MVLKRLSNTPTALFTGGRDNQTKQKPSNGNTIGNYKLIRQKSEQAEYLMNNSRGGLIIHGVISHFSLELFAMQGLDIGLQFFT